MNLPRRSPAPVLPLFCPKCDHYGAALHVNSYTVLTVRCGACLHTWAAEIALLPKVVRKQLSPDGGRPA
jgi:hypothetical protein